MVTDQEIAKGVETVLRQSDPNAITSLNGVVQQLEAKLGLDLSHKAGFIRDRINLLLQAQPTIVANMQAARQQQQQQQQPPQQQQPSIHHQLMHRDHFALHPHQPQPQHFQQFPPHFALHPQMFPQELNFRNPQVPSPMQQQLPQPQWLQQPQQQQQASRNVHPTPVEVKKESTPVVTKRRGGPGGLNKVCGVSPELQAIVGEPALPRTEIVKQLWAYIRKHSLQDPSNRRKIICDDALRLVFETDCTDMFKMNKLLSKHIITLNPTKESGQSKRVKVEIESSTEATPTALMTSEALAKFLGTSAREMTKSEASGLVWKYIKVNKLEDQLNSMVINCDPKLQELLGCESISALGVDEMLARHHLIQRS